MAGRGVVLATNYRNTREIAAFASSIVEGDEFVDLAQLMPKVGRDPSERASRTGGPAAAPAAPGNPALERRYGIRQGDEPVEG